MHQRRPTTLGRRLSAAATAILAAAALSLTAAAPALAATGPGNDLDLELGAINTGGALTFSGTFSCSGVGAANIVVDATQGTTTGELIIGKTCPATGATVSGALTPLAGSWSATGTVTWTAELKNSAGTTALAAQTGDENMATGEDDSLAADTATLNSGGGLDISGVYECNGTADRTISITATQVQGSGQTTGVGQTTVSCPTTAPTTYTVTVTPADNYQEGDTQEDGDLVGGVVDTVTGAVGGLTAGS